MIQMFDWFYDLITIEGELGYRGCYKEYIYYLQDVILKNRQRVDNSLAPEIAVSPVNYAKRTTGRCAGARQQDLLGIPEYALSRAKSIEASIMFVYLHELGHHVLGHVFGKKLTDRAGLEMSRRQEAEADRFAVMTALKSNYWLIAASPWNSFVVAFGGNSIESEVGQDHPLGIKRVLNLYEDTLSYLKRNPDAWLGEAPVDDLIASLKKDRQVIKDIADSLAAQND